MTSLELNIDSAGDLDAIYGWTRRRVRRIKVATRVPGMPPHRAEGLSAAINRDLRACGCVEGAVACVSALASLPVIGSAPWSWLPSHTLVLCGVAFVYLLLAAVLGKVAGLVLAERRLSRNVQALKALLLSPTHEEAAEICAG